ncbi:hypothetical protein EHI46_24690 [Rhizobium leguminosarum]|nr:hypothetical protein EHI46_24690 [Rhizobium leguminosarum]
MAASLPGNIGRTCFVGEVSMPSGGTSIFRLCFMDMSNTAQRATKGMVKLGLTIFVVAVIIAVAYLAFFTPGKV